MICWGNLLKRLHITPWNINFLISKVPVGMVHCHTSLLYVIHRFLPGMRGVILVFPWTPIMEIGLNLQLQIRMICHIHMLNNFQLERKLFFHTLLDTSTNGSTIGRQSNKGQFIGLLLSLDIYNSLRVLIWVTARMVCTVSLSQPSTIEIDLQSRTYSVADPCSAGNLGRHP